MTHQLAHLDGSIGGMTSWSGVCFRTIARRWRPQRQHQDSSLSYEPHTDLWSPMGIPALMDGPLADDALSDTGSDEEDEPAAMDHLDLAPTLATAAATFFDGVGGGDDGDGGGGGDVGGGGDGGGGGEATGEDAAPSRPDVAGDGDVGTKAEIMRDGQMLQLARDLRLVQDEMDRILPERVDAVNGTVGFPRHKFDWYLPA